jgi:hypothetical protein
MPTKNSCLWKFRVGARSCCRSLDKYETNGGFWLLKSASLPTARVSCVPPRETDIEKVVEEGIAWTKYVVPMVMPPKLDEDEVEGAKRIAQLTHM